MKVNVILLSILIIFPTMFTKLITEQHIKSNLLFEDFEDNEKSINMNTDEFSHLSLLLGEGDLRLLYDISHMIQQVQLKLVVPKLEDYTFKSSSVSGPKVRFKDFSSYSTSIEPDLSKMTIYDNVVKITTPFYIGNTFKVLYKAHPKEGDVDDDPTGAKVDDKCFVTYSASLEILIKMEIQVTNYVLAITVNSPFSFDKSETLILDSEEKKVFDEGLIALLKEQSNWIQIITENTKDIIHSFYNQNKEMILFKNIEFSSNFMYSLSKTFSLNIKPSAIPTSINNKYMRYKLKGFIEKSPQEKLNIDYTFDTTLSDCQIFTSFHLINSILSFNSFYLIKNEVILDDYIKGLTFDRNIEVLGIFLPEVYYYFSRSKRIKLAFKINTTKIITNKYLVDKMSEENVNIFNYSKEIRGEIKDNLFLSYNVSVNVYLANSEIILLNLNIDLLSEIIILVSRNSQSHTKSEINFKLGKAFLIDYNTDNHSGELDIAYFESFFMNNFNNFLDKNPQLLLDGNLSLNYDISKIILNNNGLVILGKYFIR